MIALGRHDAPDHLREARSPGLWAFDDADDDRELVPRWEDIELDEDDWDDLPLEDEEAGDELWDEDDWDDLGQDDDSCGDEDDD